MAQCNNLRQNSLTSQSLTKNTFLNITILWLKCNTGVGIWRLLSVYEWIVQKPLYSNTVFTSARKQKLLVLTLQQQTGVYACGFESWQPHLHLFCVQSYACIFQTHSGLVMMWLDLVVLLNFNAMDNLHHPLLALLRPSQPTPCSISSKRLQTAGLVCVPTLCCRAHSSLQTTIKSPLFWTGGEKWEETDAPYTKTRFPSDRR